LRGVDAERAGAHIASSTFAQAVHFSPEEHLDAIDAALNLRGRCPARRRESWRGARKKILLPRSRMREGTDTMTFSVQVFVKDEIKYQASPR
jgi:hypothetical protein